MLAGSAKRITRKFLQRRRGEDFGSCSSTQLVRGLHTGHLYVHHTVAEVGKDSAAVTLGLINALKRLRPGVGYFRPIDATTVEGERAKLVKHVFKLGDELSAMQGMKQAQAYDLLVNDDLDDLLEHVFTAYESYKGRHDFVIIEGTHLKNLAKDTSSLNAQIASALGASVFLVTDADLVIGKGQDHGDLQGDNLDWAAEVANYTRLTGLAFEKNNVSILGTLVHSTPSIPGIRDVFTKLFSKWRLTFAGSLPLDSVLHAIQVKDLMQSLRAELISGADVESLSAIVTNCFVATEQLKEVLDRVWRKGTGLITTGDRVEFLLGINCMKEWSENVSAVVLVGGKVTDEVKQLVQDCRIPVLVSSLSPFQAAAAIAKLHSFIDSGPGSESKISRAKALFDEHIDNGVIKRAVFEEKPVALSPILFKNSIFLRAKQNKQVILLPEGDEPRTIHAAGFVLKHDLCNLILLGAPQKISDMAKKYGVDISSAVIKDPSQLQEWEKYVNVFYQARKHKGVTIDQAREMLKNDAITLGTCILSAGDADGMVSGAVHTTANTVRPALQIIKTEAGVPIVSSVFFICLQDKVLVYGDVAINQSPSSEELAIIAIASADTATAFGIEPRVAMLSYATGDSNAGPLVQKVIEAVSIAKCKRPELLIEGPFQYDAAVNPLVASIKLKGKSSPVAGKANVFIFPDLNSSNIACKAVQQHTGAVAIGPILQGLRKPVNDLSRGCTVKDVIATIATTAVQAAYVKEKLLVSNEVASHS